MDKYLHPQIPIYDQALADKSAHYINTATEVYGEILATFLFQHVYSLNHVLLTKVHQKIGGYLNRSDQMIYTEDGLTYRKDIHFMETFVIINALSEAKQQKDFELTVPRFHFYKKKGDWEICEITIKANRVQLIERLEWISGQSFGDDLYQWRRWFMLKNKEDVTTLRKFDLGIRNFSTTYNPNYWQELWI